MAWNPNFIVDGSTPGVTSINGLFTGAQTYINGLDRESLRRGAMNIDQTPSVVKDIQVVSHYDTQAHAYSYATFGGAGGSLDYATFGANGGSSIAGLYTGDRALIGHPDNTGSAPPQAVLTFNSGTGWLVGNNGSDGVQGILAAFNVDVLNIEDAGTIVHAMICLQFKRSGSATWWTLPKTERWVSRDDHKISATDASESMFCDVPIRTWIGEEQLTTLAGGNAATDKITGIRAMCTMDLAGAAAVLKLGSFRLTGIPVLSSLVS